MSKKIIIKPLLTEKTSTATEKHNRYAFWVDVDSNKNQIKTTVEKLFNVKVLNVKTQVAPGKIKRLGAKAKKLSSRKKAFVQIAEGQKIEFFQGV